MITNSNGAMISFNGCLLSLNRVVLRPQSPILTPAEITAIRESSAAQENLKKAVQMMSGFYQRSDHWMRYAAHNHLRVSRIIRSLALLQGEEAAKQFLARIGARVEAARLD